MKRGPILFSTWLHRVKVFPTSFLSATNAGLLGVLAYRIVSYFLRPVRVILFVGVRVHTVHQLQVTTVNISVRPSVRRKYTNRNETSASCSGFLSFSTGFLFGQYIKKLLHSI